MLERQLKEMEPEQARTDEIMTAYLGYTDSELDYDTATSPTTSEVDEADETRTTMREEGRRINWEEETINSSRDDDWGRALLEQIRNNNQQRNASNSGSI